MHSTIHRGSFHTEVMPWDRNGGNYQSHRRIYAYIAEYKYISIKKDIISIKESMFCKHQSYVICQKITNENIHSNNIVVKYLNSSSNIDF